ncbi:UNVERIFIED_CONTAM: hypothetical protein HHA_284040 [Hammondia hammondi]|eukprot:XP_008888041.1 hypothetical protein HHA_284040 [Hammondia hammondi]
MIARLLSRRRRSRSQATTRKTRLLLLTHPSFSPSASSPGLSSSFSSPLSSSPLPSSPLPSSPLPSSSRPVSPVSSSPSFSLASSSRSCPEERSPFDAAVAEANALLRRWPPLSPFVSPLREETAAGKRACESRERAADLGDAEPTEEREGEDCSGEERTEERNAARIAEAQEALKTVERIRRVLCMADAERSGRCDWSAQGIFPLIRSEQELRRLSSIWSRRVEKLLLLFLREAFEIQHALPPFLAPAVSSSSALPSPSFSSSFWGWQPESSQPAETQEERSGRLAGFLESLPGDAKREGCVERELRALKPEEEETLNSDFWEETFGEHVVVVSPMAALSLEEIAEVALHAKNHSEFRRRPAFWQSLTSCVLAYLPQEKTLEMTPQEPEVGRRGERTPKTMGVSLGECQLAVHLRWKDSECEKHDEATSEGARRRVSKTHARPWIDILRALVETRQLNDARAASYLLSHIRRNTFLASLDDLLHASHLLAVLHGAHWEAGTVDRAVEFAESRDVNGASPALEKEKETRREETSRAKKGREEEENTRGEPKKKERSSCASVVNEVPGTSPPSPQSLPSPLWSLQSTSSTPSLAPPPSASSSASSAAPASSSSRRVPSVCMEESERRGEEALASEVHSMLSFLRQKSLLRRKEMPLCVVAAVLHAHALWQAAALEAWRRRNDKASLAEPPAFCRVEDRDALAEGRMAKAARDAGQNRQHAEEEEEAGEAETSSRRQIVSSRKADSQDLWGGEPRQPERGERENEERQEEEKEESVRSCGEETKRSLRSGTQTGPCLESCVYRSIPCLSLVSSTPSFFGLLGRKAATQISLERLLSGNRRSNREETERQKPHRRKGDLRHIALLFAAFAKTRLELPSTLLRALEARWGIEEKRESECDRRGDEAEETKVQKPSERGRRRTQREEQILEEKDELLRRRGKVLFRRDTATEELQTEAPQSIVLLLSVLSRSEEGRRSAAFAVLAGALTKRAHQLTGEQLAMGLHALSLGHPSVVKRNSLSLLFRFLFDHGRLHKLSGSHLRLVLAALSRSPPPRGGLSPSTVDACARFLDTCRAPHKMPLNCLSELLRLHSVFRVFDSQFLMTAWKVLQRRATELTRLSHVTRSLQSLAVLPTDLLLKDATWDRLSDAERMSQPDHATRHSTSPLASPSSSSSAASSVSAFSSATTPRLCRPLQDESHAVLLAFVEARSQTLLTLERQAEKAILGLLALSLSSRANSSADSTFCLCMRGPAERSVEVLPAPASSSSLLSSLSSSPFCSSPSSASSMSGSRDRSPSRTVAACAQGSLTKADAARLRPPWEHTPRELTDLLHALAQLIPPGAEAREEGEPSSFLLTFASPSALQEKEFIAFTPPRLRPSLLHALRLLVQQPESLAFFAFDQTSLARLFAVSIHLLSRLASQGKTAEVRQTVSNSILSSSSTSSPPFSSSHFSAPSWPHFSSHWASSHPELVPLEKTIGVLHSYIASAAPRPPCPLFSPSHSSMSLFRLFPLLLRENSASSPAAPSPLAEAAAPQKGLTQAQEERQGGREETRLAEDAAKERRDFADPRERGGEIKKSINEALTVFRSGCNAPFLFRLPSSSSSPLSSSSYARVSSSSSPSTSPSPAPVASASSLSTQIASVLGEFETNVLSVAYSHALPGLLEALAFQPSEETNERKKRDKEGESESLRRTPRLGRRRRHSGDDRLADFQIRRKQEGKQEIFAREKTRVSCNNEPLAFSTLLDLLVGLLTASLRRLLSASFPPSRPETTPQDAGKDEGEKKPLQDGERRAVKQDGGQRTGIEGERRAGKTRHRSRLAESQDAGETKEDELQREILLRLLRALEKTRLSAGDEEQAPALIPLLSLALNGLQFLQPELWARFSSALTRHLRHLQSKRDEERHSLRCCGDSPSVSPSPSVLTRLLAPSGNHAGLPLLSEKRERDNASALSSSDDRGLLGGRAKEEPLPRRATSEQRGTVRGFRTSEKEFRRSRREPLSPDAVQFPSDHIPLCLESSFLPAENEGFFQSAPRGGAPPPLSPVSPCPEHEGSEEARLGLSTAEMETRRADREAKKQTQVQTIASEKREQQEERRRRKEAARWLLPSAVQTGGSVRGSKSGVSCFSGSLETRDGAPGWSPHSPGRVSWSLCWSHRRSVEASHAAAVFLFRVFCRLSEGATRLGAVCEEPGDLGERDGPCLSFPSGNPRDDCRKGVPHCMSSRSREGVSRDLEVRETRQTQTPAASRPRLQSGLRGTTVALDSLVALSWRLVSVGGRSMFRIDLQRQEKDEAKTATRGDRGSNRMRLYFFLLAPDDVFLLPVFRRLHASLGSSSLSPLSLSPLCEGTKPSHLSSSSSASLNSASSTADPEKTQQREKRETGKRSAALQCGEEESPGKSALTFLPHRSDATLLHPRVFLELYVADKVLTQRSNACVVESTSSLSSKATRRCTEKLLFTLSIFAQRREFLGPPCHPTRAPPDPGLTTPFREGSGRSGSC